MNAKRSSKRSRREIAINRDEFQRFAHWLYYNNVVMTAVHTTDLCADIPEQLMAIEIGQRLSIADADIVFTLFENGARAVLYGALSLEVT